MLYMVNFLCDMVKLKLRATSYELLVTNWKLQSTSWNLKVQVQIHKLRVQTHKLRVRIHEFNNHLIKKSYTWFFPKVSYLNTEYTCLKYRVHLFYLIKIKSVYYLWFAKIILSIMRKVYFMTTEIDLVGEK